MALCVDKNVIDGVQGRLGGVVLCSRTISLWCFDQACFDLSSNFLLSPPRLFDDDDDGLEGIVQ